MFSKVTIEVDIVDNLADMNGSEVVIVFATSFVMSGGYALEERMFDARRIWHLQIEFNVDGGADKLRREERENLSGKQVDSMS